MKRVLGGVMWTGIGILGALAIYEVATIILPPVLPAVRTAQVIANPRIRPQRKNIKVSSSSSPTPQAGPDGLAEVSYTMQQRQAIATSANTLGFRALLPKWAYPGTTLLESYVEGQDLDLEFSNMMAVEAKTPIASDYPAGSSVNVTLSNGVPAQWLLVYGVGGPGYRLLFEEGGTYVRLEMFSAYVPSALANVKTIAAQFSPLGSMGSDS